MVEYYIPGIGSRNVLSTPLSHLSHVNQKLLEEGCPKSRYDKKPSCWNHCPMKLYDVVRKKRGENELTMDVLDGLWRDNWNADLVLIAFNIAFGTVNKSIQIRYGGLHKCPACYYYFESGAIPQWRCKKCEHYSLTIAGVRICYGGPDAPPKFEREIWANSFPCNYYKRRGNVPPPMPAPYTEEDKIADMWFSARVRAGHEILNYIGKSKGKYPDRDFLIIAISKQFPDLKNDGVAMAVDDATSAWREHPEKIREILEGILT